MPRALPRLCFLCAFCLLTACAGPDYTAFYHAEQGDYASALAETEGSSSLGLLRTFLVPDNLQCREYQDVVNLMVAGGDFNGALSACTAYREACAVQPENGLCFSYAVSALEGAGGNADAAAALTEDARTRLHFRWLTVRDDYQGNALRRPIY
jgi:hypothetical protein